MLNTMLAPGSSRTTFLPVLAGAVTSAFKLLRIGPYGHAQREWQIELSQSGHLLGTEAPIGQALVRHDQARSLPEGTAMALWAETVIRPALREVAELFDSKDLITDHPNEVRQGLLGTNLLPQQAAERIRRSQVDLASEVARLLSSSTLQQLRCPIGTEEFNWTGSREAYAQHLAVCRRGVDSQQVQYPVSTKNWDHLIRANRIDVRLPLQIHEFDADLRQRLWLDNHIKITGLLLWHPKALAVDNMLLRSITHANPHEAAIAALASHLYDNRHTGAAGPVLMIETMAKAGALDKDEVAAGVVEFTQTLLRVMDAPPNVGTVVYNTLPWPWIYAPHQTELLPADWTNYVAQRDKVRKIAKRITGRLCAALGPNTASVSLDWNRRG